MTHANVDVLERQPDSPATITYWLQHNGEFLTSVLAPPGLPGQTIRFIAAQQYDTLPLCEIPHENPTARRQRILSARVIVYGDSSNDMFAERVKEVA